jgi:hypothetical protein
VVTPHDKNKDKEKYNYPAWSTWASGGNASKHKDKEEKNYKGARAQTEVESAIEFLRMAEKAKVDDIVIETANRRVEETRAARDKATPPDQIRSRLQRKVDAKEATVAKAREAESRCKDALQQTTAALEEAAYLVAQRHKELHKLQEERDAVQADDEVSCEGEDERLEEKFRGDVEVVRLYRQLEEAKSRRRERNAASSNGQAKAREGSDDADHDGNADHGGDWIEPNDMEFTFDGADVSDDDLEALGAAGAGVDVEQRMERKHKLAKIIEHQCWKKLRNGQGTGVRRTHAKQLS